VIGRLVCALYAHKWAFLFSNDHGRAVFGCQRCMKVRAAS
jgi:hypothetical protein